MAVFSKNANCNRPSMRSMVELAMPRSWAFWVWLTVTSFALPWTMAPF
jgi:hypothetical protein